MQLNDKALVKLMRRAYKGGGIKLMRTANALVANGGWWCLLVDWDCVPSPVLGLLAEWLRKLPEPHTAWMCVEDAEEPAQTITTAEAGHDVLRLASREDLPDFIATKIGYSDSMLVQTAEKEVYWLPSVAADVVDSLSGGRIAHYGLEDWAVFESRELGAIMAIMCSEAVPSKISGKLAEIDFYAVAGRREEVGA